MDATVNRDIAVDEPAEALARGPGETILPLVDGVPAGGTDTARALIDPMPRYGRAVVAIPNGPEFLPAFYGVQRAGGIAVPVFPGLSSERILHMAALCDARFALLPSATPRKELDQFRWLALEAGVTPITINDVQTVVEQSDFPDVGPDDVAFIQYTSGSTGNPKGVQLTHRNLLTNIQQMIVGMESSAEDIFVSWLPLYHDMGLILMSMTPFMLGAKLHLLPTRLTNIRLWLDTIQSHRATFTAAPDFAYRLAVRRITNPEEYDLTSLRVALNAAEPVRWRTIEAFEQTFRLKNVMAAAYGLAEATVGVSTWRPGTAPRVDDRGIVSVGRPFPGVKVTILQDGQPAAPGQVGEIVIESPANSRGYFNNPAACEELFWHGGGIHSGDLGYIDEEGFLYIVGRKKHIIKHGGHTIYPQEIEEVVGGLPGVRLSAAVGIDKGGVEGEQVTIFAEVRRGVARRNEMETMVIEIVQRFHDRFGFRPGKVYLVKAKTIPQTHNGKLRHLKLKEDFLQGRLGEDGLILFP